VFVRSNQSLGSYARSARKFYGATRLERAERERRDEQREERA